MVTNKYDVNCDMQHFWLKMPTVFLKGKYRWDVLKVNAVGILQKCALITRIITCTCRYVLFWMKFSTISKLVTEVLLKVLLSNFIYFIQLPILCTILDTSLFSPWLSICWLVNSFELLHSQTNYSVLTPWVPGIWEPLYAIPCSETSNGSTVPSMSPSLCIPCLLEQKPIPIIDVRCGVVLSFFPFIAIKKVSSSINENFL